MPLRPATPDNIREAAQLLKAGRLVAFPTETVYGLGADATNGKAVASVFAVKGRPEINPLIIHVHRIEALDALIEWNDQAEALARQFWPGPLTLVLPRKGTSTVSLLASAGLETLAVRIPSHPVAFELLRAFDGPVAAPSANLSGKLSPTTPIHVAESLGDRVDMILAGGRTKIGLESTVVDLTTSPPRILRHGGLTKEHLMKVVHNLENGQEGGNPAEPQKAPGLLAAHYAPERPLRRNALQAGPDEALLAFGSDKHTEGGALRLNLSPTGDLEEAAANLFAMLRQLDRAKINSIAVMPIPEHGLGAAINDRLMRASIR